METLISLSPILLLVLVFYFFLIRPQQKKSKEIRVMQSKLQKVNQMMTIGGLSVVIEVFDDFNIIITCNHTKLTFDRAAIRELKQGELALHRQNKNLKKLI